MKRSNSQLLSVAWQMHTQSTVCAVKRNTLQRLTQAAFSAEELEYLNSRAEFTAACHRMETFDDFERIVELGEHLLAPRPDLNPPWHGWSLRKT